MLTTNVLTKRSILKEKSGSKRNQTQDLSAMSCLGSTVYQTMAPLKIYHQYFSLFVVLTCHWPVLDGFNQDFQATVYYPLSGAVD